MLKNSVFGRRENSLGLNLQGKGRTRGRLIGPSLCQERVLGAFASPFASIMCNNAQ